MTAIEEIQNKRKEMILSDLKAGVVTASPNRVAEITGWNADSIKNSIREGKVHFGFCHRSENCKSWTTLIDLVKLYDYLNEYRGQNHISE